MIDPIALSQELIRCPSVTPLDAGALGVVQNALESLGFTCHRLPFGDVDNIYARKGNNGNNLCFAGHTDVVPVGDEAAWSVPPFDAAIQDGVLIGRGAVDMKPAIAAWIAAISALETDIDGSLSLLITGDEEAQAINGTVKVIEWLREKGETIDACIVGEPTNPDHLGEMIKIGRRGSITFDITVRGVQGHVAYPDSADNPVTYLVTIANALQIKHLDDGTEHFLPSNLEITTIDVGNAASNVIAATASLKCNIRFNTHHTGASLEKWVKEICKKHADNVDVSVHHSGDAFLTPEGDLSALVQEAVENVTGKKPVCSTTGGTSDARFIKNICPVVECGLINETAHKVDEQIAVKDIERLTQIYKQIIEGYC